MGVRQFGSPPHTTAPVQTPPASCTAPKTISNGLQQSPSFHSNLSPTLLPDYLLQPLPSSNTIHSSHCLHKGSHSSTQNSPFSEPSSSPRLYLLSRHTEMPSVSYTYPTLPHSHLCSNTLLAVFLLQISTCPNPTHAPTRASLPVSHSETTPLSSGFHVQLSNEVSILNLS